MCGTRLEAFRLALERYDGAEPVNLGSGKEVAIRDLAVLIAGLPSTTARSSGTPRGRTANRAAA